MSLFFISFLNVRISNIENKLRKKENNRFSSLGFCETLWLNYLPFFTGLFFILYKNIWTKLY